MLLVSLVAADNLRVPAEAWAELSANVRRSPLLTLKQLSGVDLTEYDSTLPHSVVETNASCLDENSAVLSYYRAQARIRRRVAAVAVLRTAWRRSHGQPACAGPPTTRAASLAYLLQLRRVCRLREGKDEVAEPFGRCVVAYL